MHLLLGNARKTECAAKLFLARLVVRAAPFALLTMWAMIGVAQESGPPPVEMSVAEQQFQEQMTNVTMTGFFTVGEEAATHEDSYTIERVTKTKAELWNFEARVKYNGRDFKATIPVPVKWAGDTPVLTLSNYLIKGQGVFSARILIYNGMYAGTWGAQSHGGKMFGKIVKNQPAP